jgi:outer membrane protein assembly factor BamB
MSRKHCPGLAYWLTLSAAIGAAPTAAWARQSNPVYVDDSPRAWELFRRGQDLAPDNPSESVRLYQELLDDYGLKLVPINEASPDHFAAVRLRVLAELRTNETLLQRYRVTETAQAERLLAAGRLRTLAMTRPLTEPGLEALLRLAQQDLESARFHAALDRLREATAHPHFGDDLAAHGHFMTGMAAHYLGDARLLKASIAALARLGDEGAEARAQLEALAATDARSPVPRGRSSLDPAPATDLTGLVAQAIWSVGLEQSLLQRQYAHRATSRMLNPALEHRRREGDLMTATATVAGSVVYVNQGYEVLALDRFTGRSVWPRPYVDEPGGGGIERDDQQTHDLNVVTLSGDTLITLTGHARSAARTGRGRVVCLDTETGRPRWTATIDRIGGIDDHEGLFPYGTPIVSEGLVFVLARKVSPQLLTSCYVIALDVTSGGLRWARHLCSSGGLKSRVARPFSTLTYEHGDLFVASPVGAMARLDAATGQVRWLRRFDVPITSYASQRRPWEIGGPVVTARGVIALAPDQRRTVLLETETGDLIESVAATTLGGWAAPRYLLADDRFVYAVGRELRAFDIDALDKPRWRLSDAPPATVEPSSESPTQIRGRVQLVDGGLIVPTTSGVAMVERQSGQPVHWLAVKATGNPLAVGEQLILAGSDRLDAYMSLTSAERVLRERLASNPADPGPALSLVRLGMRGRDLGLALEAAGLALEATIAAHRPETAAAARQELFAMLLEIDRQRIAQTTEQGESLHAMIGTVAIDPEQRAEHLLAYADWLADRNLARAVETYQAVLSDPILASTPRSESGTVRPAADWATHRLRRLIEEYGSRAYLPQADFARLRRDQLVSDGNATPEQLLALADQFPFAAASLHAVRRAAETRRQNGDDSEALAALTTSYRRAPHREAAAQLLGLVASTCVERGWTGQARAVLGHVTRAHGNLRLFSGDGPRGAETWLAELETRAAVPHPPRVGTPEGPAEPLPGRLVRDSGHESHASDYALLIDGPSLRLIRSSKLETAWSVELEAENPKLLLLDPANRGVLLWLDADPDDPRAILLDGEDGSMRWVTQKLDAERVDPLRQLARNRGIQEQMPDGRPFNPAETIALIDEQRLFMVRRTGEASAFDLADGQRLPGWRHEPRLVQIHLAALHAYGLVLAGHEAGGGEGGLSPVILIVDPETGATVHRITPLGGAAVKWIALDPLGGLVYGSTVGMELVDVLSGETLWSNIAYEALDTQQAWSLAEHLIIEDRSNELRALRLDEGTLSDPFDPPARGEWQPSDLRQLLIASGGCFARYQERIVRFDVSGAVRGADVITDDRDYRWLLPAGDRLVLVSKVTTAPAPVNDARWRSQETYRIYSLSDSCKLLGEALELPLLTRRETAVLIDGWLLLSSQSDTVAIPLPPGG